MPEALPAISLVAVPGRRRQTVEVAAEIERRGFAGIYAPSMFGQMPLCEALAWRTERVPFGPMIAPIYARTPLDFAQEAAALHEVSGGRFRLGVGVAHAPSHARMGVTVGRPLGDTREFVARLRAVEGIGPLPPIVLATLRQKMVALAGEIADGLVFANAARSHMGRSLSALPAERRDNGGFFVGCMIPTCISDDIEAAKAVNRRNLTFYLSLPNYRNYWKEAGYADEMAGVERALAEGRQAEMGSLMPDRWLDDVSLFGPASRVRDGIEAWRDAGVGTPIIVPSSANGNQMRALEEAFAAFR